MFTSNIHVLPFISILSLYCETCSINCKPHNKPPPKSPFLLVGFKASPMKVVWWQRVSHVNSFFVVAKPAFVFDYCLSMFSNHMICILCIYIYIYIYTYIHTYIHTYITLHYITLHYITLHYITLHYTTLHYITLHYITLHYITLHYITLHYITYIHTYIHYIHHIHMVHHSSHETSSIFHMVPSWLFHLCFSSWFYQIHQDLL